MRDSVIEALKSRFLSYDDLIAAVGDEYLEHKLDVPKHKSLAEHLWCVVGARESYARAIAEGEWQGFSCSMASFSRQDFVGKLKSSADAVTEAMSRLDDWSRDQEQFLLALAEHEVMHEGQLIRHLYGMEVDIPASVKWA